MKKLLDMVKDKKLVIIFGYAAVGRQIFELLQKEFFGEMVFCDNSTVKQGKHDGAEVLSMIEAVHYYQKMQKAVFIVASIYHSKQMTEQLRNKGVAETDIITELPHEVIIAEEKGEQEKRHQKRDYFRYEVNIVKHCNLNCKGCDHFAPIAKPWFLEPEEYARDAKRIEELFPNKVQQIHLLGGEPLLHPDIADFMKAAREASPEAEIYIDTNGTLLAKMSERFWQACQEYAIDIMPTKYPINVDYEALGKLVRSYGRKYVFLGSSESGRTLWKFPLDLEGKQVPWQSFRNCRNANACITLERGRLYTCSIAPNISVFNEYFKKNIELRDDDGIDIYKAKDGEEVLKKLAQPIPFCRFCDVKNRTYDNPWEVSERKIEEWT